MGCKNCKAVFRRPPIDEFEDADEYCPRCDAHLVVEAELPEPPRNIMLNLEASGESQCCKYNISFSYFYFNSISLCCCSV
jgi:hypothetical protein